MRMVKTGSKKYSRWAKRALEMIRLAGSDGIFISELMELLPNTYKVGNRTRTIYGLEKRFPDLVVKSVGQKQYYTYIGADRLDGESTTSDQIRQDWITKKPGRVYVSRRDHPQFPGFLPVTQGDLQDELSLLPSYSLRKWGRDYYSTPNQNVPQLKL